jgi:hypothetical protein
VNAAVSEDARLLGLRPGRRYLYLGVPLLPTLSVSQLTSVLAHELGHYSHGHTSLGALAYRGGAAIARVVEQVGPHTIVGRVFGWYGNLYFLVAHAVHRRQELEADAASVAIAGREAATSALRELPVIDAAWAFYLNRYVAAGWEAGYAPEDPFGGFARLVAARRDELAGLRTEEAPEQRSRWDSHPPISARVAAMAAMPRGAAVPDDRPATVLVPDFDRVGRETARATLAYGDRTVLDWDEYVSVGLVAEDQSVADFLFRAAGRLNGTRAANLDTVLRTVARGDGPRLAAAAFPEVPPAERAEPLAAAVEAAMRVAAVRSLAARWQHSWAGPARLVDAGGTPMDLAPAARLATDPAGVDRAWVELTRLDINAAAVDQVDRTVPVAGAEILGGLSDVKVDGKAHDILILTVGLILVPTAKLAARGGDRLRRLAGSGPVADLAARHRFLPYEEIASAKLGKRVPIRVELRLHDGSAIALRGTWSGDRLTKDSDALMYEAVRPYLES